MIDILTNRGVQDSLRPEGCKEFTCWKTWNKSFQGRGNSVNQGPGRKSGKLTVSGRGWSQVSGEVTGAKAVGMGGADKADTCRQWQGAWIYPTSSILFYNSSSTVICMPGYPVAKVQ